MPDAPLPEKLDPVAQPRIWLRRVADCVVHRNVAAQLETESKISRQSIEL
jgi:hypothetical protein